MKNNLRALLLVLIVVLSSGFNLKACDYTLVMKGNLYNGVMWTGVTMKVSINGTITSYSYTGSVPENSYVFSVSDGDQITVQAENSGFFFNDDAIGYYVEDAEGNIVITNGVDATGNLAEGDGQTINTSVMPYSATCPVQPVYNLSLQSYLAPAEGLCANDANQVTSVIIKNSGNTTLTGFSLNLEIDGSIEETVVYNDNLDASLSDTVDFAAFDFSTPAEYDIKVFVTQIAGDNNQANDTLSWSVTTFSPVAVTDVAEFTEAFEGLNNYFYLSNGNQADASIENVNGSNVIRLTGGNIQGWTGDATTTTATNAWNDNTSHLSSAYLCTVDATAMTSTCEMIFDLKQTYSQGIKYSWFRVLINGNPVADVNGTENFNPAATNNDFQTITFDLDAYVGQSFTVEFQASNCYDEVFAPGDNAYIDNLIIRKKLSKDLGVSDILSPETACGLTANEDIQVVISNYGQDAVSDFTVSYTINNGVAVDSVVTNANIQPGATYNYTFSNVDFSAVGEYSINAYTSFIDDANNTNDASSNTVYNLPTYTVDEANPYFEGFENVNYWLGGGTSSSWDIGTPNSGAINAATEGSNVAMTNLTGFYNNDEESYLMSPCFDLSGLVLPIIEFDYYIISENNIDAASFQVCTDGSTWTTIGNVGDGTNWYTGDSYAYLNWTGNISGWSGNSNGWKRASITASSLAAESNVKFRFVFGSDATNTNHGFAVDSIVIKESASTHNLSIIDWVTPVSTNCNQTSAEIVSFSITNLGLVQESSYYVSYSIDNGNNFVQQHFTDAINPLQTLQLSFTATADMAGAGTYNCIVQLDSIGGTVDGDLNDNIATETVIGTGVDEIVGEFTEDFNAASDFFGTVTDTKSNISYSNGMLKFEGSDGAGWLGSSSLNGTTSQQAWSDNSEFISSAFTCNVDATGLTTLELLFDLKQTYIYGPGYSWFRVLVNGTPISDVEGTANFRPSTPNSDDFNTLRFNLDSYIGQQFVLSFESSNRFSDAEANVQVPGESGNAAYLDNLILRQKLAIDAGVVDIVSPSTGCGLTGNQSVVVTIENFGLNAISGFDVSYNFDGTIVTENVSQSIPSGTTYDYTFATTVDFTLLNPGVYNVSAWTDSTYDTYANNNLFENYEVEYIFHDFTNSSYTTGFENGLEAGWAVTDNNNNGKTLQLLSPANAYEGTKMYGYNFINGNANEWLFSRCFVLESGVSYKISYLFGTTAEKSISLYYGNSQDAGSMTQMLSSNSNINTNGAATYDYEVFTVATSGVYYFGWNVTGTVSYTNKYLYIDDIEIRIINPVDLSVSQMDSPVNDCELTSAETIEIQVMNNGNHTLDANTQIPVAFTFDGNTYNENFTLISDLGVGNSVSYTFTQTVDLSAIGQTFNFNIEVSYPLDTITSNNVLAASTMSYGYPDASFSGLDAGYCLGANMVTLTPVNAGGDFYGNGISGSDFDPAVANVGTHEIKYVFTDGNGCKDSTTQSTLVSNPIVDLGNDIDTNYIGTLTLDAGSGVGYVYAWSTGVNTQTITNLDYGIYSVSVTQDYCTVSDEIEILLGTTTQDVNLIAGWSMFSTYIDVNDDIENVLAPVANDIWLVKDGVGNVYIPNNALIPGYVNNIGMMDDEMGYQIKMENAQMLSLTDTAIFPELTPIALSADYNIFAYLRWTEMSVVSAMSSIVNDVIIVKDDIGKVYWPYYNFNNLGNLKPGEAYKVKMDNPNTFTFPANDAPVAKSLIIENSPVKYDNIRNTGANMILGIPQHAWNNTPNVGDEIAVVSASGIVVGSAVYNGEHTSVAIWADDATSSEIDGMNNGEKFTIIHWDSYTDSENSIEVNAWETGSDQFVTDGISVVKNLSITSDNSQSENPYLLQNQPNPAKDITNISFYLPSSSNVKIHLYNALGSKLRNIVSEEMSAGNHTISVDVAELPSGTYFYKMISADFADTKILTVEK